MEDDKDEEIKEVVELLKEIKENNDHIKENKIDTDIINKINKEDEKKYFKLNYTELYIVDKESIEKLLDELNYDELENLIDKNDDDDNEELNDKLEELLKDKDFSDLKDEIKDNIKVYNTETEIDDIINNNEKVTFVSESVLKKLEIPYKLYKEKEVFVARKKLFFIVYFPKHKFSIFINSSSTSNLNTSVSNIKVNNNQIQKEVNVFIPNPINNINNNINNNIVNNMNNINQNKIFNNNNNINNANNLIIPNIAMNNNINENNKNNINENGINENINNINLQINNQFNNNNNNIQINNNQNQFNNNNSQNHIQINMNNINVKFSETVNLINKAENAKLQLDKNINIVTKHILFLNYINNNLPSMNMLNLEDISQIQNINYSNKSNIILINSETFQTIGNNLLYDECSLYLNLDMNNNRQKYNELIQKIDQNNYNINPSQIRLIKSFDDFNLNPNTQFMFVNEEFCANIGLDKQQFINSYLFLFKANNQLFLFFSDKNKVMKVDKMNNYYKLNNYIGDMIDTPKDIVDNLINLYKETKIFNEYLTECELNENNFKNYYMVNKNWIELYKQYYNYEEIYVKYEEICFNEEEDINNSNINNFNQNKNNNNYGGSNKKKNKKNKKNRKKGNNKNRNNINNNDNINQKKVNNPEIKSMHKNVEIPKELLDENNIIPVIKTFKESFYPIDFELIENQTLKNLCKSLNLDVNINIYEHISIEALAGSDIIILKRKDNSIVIYSVKGITMILEYIIMFNDKNSMNNEINHIKSKGIEQYLIEKYLNFDDDSLQYIPNSENTSVVGKIYICNKRQIDYNINNNKMYYRSTSNLNNIVNNYQYINNFNYQILPARAGLNNIGATCYMNATLQCLCNIPALQNFFLYNNNLYQKQDAVVSKAFGDVMRNLYDRNKNKVSYSPTHFKNVIGEKNPLFKGVAANDSKDLIIFLLEKMHEDLNEQINYNPEPNLSRDLLVFRQSYYPSNSSIIQKTFIYEMESIVRCCNCGYETYNYNAHSFVIFPLEKIRKQKIISHPQGFYLVTLEDCFEKQQAVDYLKGESMVYCNGCKQMFAAENINKMNTCPEILIIILNRGKGNQYEVDFDFPMRCDLYNYVNEKNKNTQYELISVIVHTGGSDMSGHFYSYCKSNIDKKWYRYNDSMVDMLDDNYQITIKNNGLPYVLFYQRTNIGNNDNNMINLNNNISNGQITLYFKLIEYDKELYLDVNSNDLFSIVTQKLAQKYNNGTYNFFNCLYYVLMMNQKQFIDFNKTVQQNNLSDSSFVIIQFNK